MGCNKSWVNLGNFNVETDAEVASSCRELFANQDPGLLHFVGIPVIAALVGAVDDFAQGVTQGVNPGREHASKAITFLGLFVHGSIRYRGGKVSADGIAKLFGDIFFVVNVTEIGFHNRINVFHQLLACHQHFEVRFVFHGSIR